MNSSDSFIDASAISNSRSAPAIPDAITAPAILLAGGRPMNTGAINAAISPVLARFNKPIVAYIGAANGDSESFYEAMGSVFMNAGAGSVEFLRLARENADIAAAAESLSQADIIFLSGGEVEDGIKWLRKHRLAHMLKELFVGGKQFMGISAGAIMMGAHWMKVNVPGGWDAEDMLSRWVAGEIHNKENGVNIELFECLGLIPAIFDTHAEDEDWVELKATLRLIGDGARGCGIPRGGIIKAGSRGELENIESKYITYAYINGSYKIL